jgi:hypothetical protein
MYRQFALGLLIALAMPANALLTLEDLASA